MTGVEWIIAAVAALTIIVCVIQARRCAPPVVEPEPEPIYVDECETCRRKLTADEVHELRSYAEDDEYLTEGRTMGGGSYMSATYCAEHFPVDTASSVAGDVES